MVTVAMIAQSPQMGDMLLLYATFGMGIYRLSAGVLEVTLSNDADGKVAADAVRVTEVPGTGKPEKNIIDNAEASSNDRLVAYYPFNGNAEDESCSRNHGTVFGATLAEDRFGDAKSAYSFDGEDDYIDVPSFSNLVLNKMTVSTWVNTVSGDINNHRIITIHDSVDPEYHYFDIESNSGRGLDVYIDGEAVGEFDWNFEPDTWTHITVTWDGSNVRIYKNTILTETGIRDAAPRSGT